MKFKYAFTDSTKLVTEFETEYTSADKDLAYINVNESKYSSEVVYSSTTMNNEFITSVSDYAFNHEITNAQVYAEDQLIYDVTNPEVNVMIEQLDDKLVKKLRVASYK